MSVLTTRKREALEQEYDEYAREYLDSLPLTHFMESTDQSRQRAITDASMELVRRYRPEIQCFGELLVQYPIKGQKKPGQVVPDNMVFICETPIEAKTNFTIQLQPVSPFWVLEYVSKHNARKDNEVNMRKYERELKVPYYLLFYPDNEELSLFFRKRGRYTTVYSNSQERLEIPELELQMAIRNRFVRFWFRGQLIPLPGELQAQLEQVEAGRLKAETEVVQARMAQQQAETETVQERTARVKAEAAAVQARLAQQQAEAVAQEQARVIEELKARLAASDPQSRPNPK